MAFNIANLAPVGNSSKPLSGVGTTELKGAPSIWSYATADVAADVNTAGYFNGGVANGGAYNLLNPGDMIYALCGAGSGGTLAPTLFVVLSKSAGVLDVNNGTAQSISDSD
jgi:hypothetical protein